jgi:hypothetical protein
MRKEENQAHDLWKGLSAMDQNEHFFSYLMAWLSFAFFLAFFDMLNWWFVGALLAGFFLVNPDLDHIFKDHRNFIFHSALYPVLIYWILHPYWNMVTAKELGIVLFYPVLIHLICDFYDIWKKKQGYALISAFGKRMNDTQSKIYVLVNIIGIAAYMVWVL